MSARGVGRDAGAARESESFCQVELVLRGKNTSCRGWGANVLSNFPERFPRCAGKGWEGRGDVLPLPALIITQQVGVEGAGGSCPRCVQFAFLEFITPPIRGHPALL